MAPNPGPPSRGPEARSRGRHALWVTVAVVVLAAIAYFIFFTGTPDEGTRPDPPEPAPAAESG
ncbi:hypothetical protein [Jiella marina]|uniref:hypothetical protein n=1 Tax=Jiella sp. LLJ827 TaxID=2917712 RepID=UPI0021016486|nr:hypothetical protein [Jiella sp. LLJ827]MCQ0987334.1 hypothetical protein [Jiella sp. LLJ827]